MHSGESQTPFRISWATGVVSPSNKSQNVPNRMHTTLSWVSMRSTLPVGVCRTCMRGWVCHVQSYLPYPPHSAMYSSGGEVVNVYTTILKGTRCDGKVALTSRALILPRYGAFWTSRTRWPHCVPHLTKSIYTRSDTSNHIRTHRKLISKWCIPYHMMLYMCDILHLLLCPTPCMAHFPST